MKYVRGAEIDWNSLAPDAVLRFRPHHLVRLSDHSLFVACDAPGWAAVPNHQLDALQEIEGLTVRELNRRSVEASNEINVLYRAGLISLGDERGLIGEPECGRETAHADAEKTNVTPVKAVAPHPDTLLVKLTGACNWACTYCYDYDSRRFRESVDLEDIEKTIEDIVTNHRRITVMFHGGEPLLRYAELKRIVGFVSERCALSGATARFSLQTNGVFVDEDVIAFLDRNSFDIGMSIDGPPTINDRTRVDHLGRGTAHHMEKLFSSFPDFMRRRVGYITTVTSQNVDSLEEVASYLRGLGVQSWKTAIFDTEGRGASAHDLRPAVDPYVRFLLRWLEECEAGAWNGFKFNNILELIDVVSSSSRRNLCLKFPCGAAREFVVASADKRLMACDATYHANFDLGPLASGLGAVQSTAALALFEREQWLLSEAECSTCPWLHYCAGTCMAKALIRHGTIKAVDDFECAVRKAIFPAIFEKLIRTPSGLRSYYLSSRRPSRGNG